MVHLEAISLSSHLFDLDNRAFNQKPLFFENDPLDLKAVFRHYFYEHSVRKEPNKIVHSSSSIVDTAILCDSSCSFHS